MAYEVNITPEGFRYLRRLPAKVTTAVVETISRAIAEDPHTAGNALRGELEGLRSTRRGDFRIVYEIDDDARVVLIHRAQHRREVYRRR